MPMGLSCPQRADVFARSLLQLTHLRQMYCMSSAAPTASILTQACAYICTTVQHPATVPIMTDTMVAVVTHWRRVKPVASENCEPFSTMYAALHTLHFSESGLSAVWGGRQKGLVIYIGMPIR